MFLSKDYVLANEVANKLNISTSNISGAIKLLDNSGDDSYVKRANTLFLKHSYNLPKSIRDCISSGLENNEFTDVSNVLPRAWMNLNHNLLDDDLIPSGIAEKVNILGKLMYKFNQEFVDLSKKHIPYVLNEKEMLECYNKGQILSYTELRKNRYLTWY